MPQRSVPAQLLQIDYILKKEQPKAPELRKLNGFQRPEMLLGIVKKLRLESEFSADVLEQLWDRIDVKFFIEHTTLWTALRVLLCRDR